MSTIYVKWSTVNPVLTRAGECLTWYFQVKDKSGAVVDITAWTFAAYFQDRNNPANLITVTNSDFTIITPASGLAKFVMLRAVTVNQGGNTFDGEIWRVDAGNDDSLADGEWQVLASARPAP